MQVRLLQQFCEKYRIPSTQANRLFKEHSIWEYVEDCYETLHMCGDEYVLGDISDILTAQGVAL